MYFYRLIVFTTAAMSNENCKLCRTKGRRFFRPPVYLTKDVSRRDRLIQNLAGRLKRIYERVCNDTENVLHVGTNVCSRLCSIENVTVSTVSHLFCFLSTPSVSGLDYKRVYKSISLIDIVYMKHN